MLKQVHGNPILITFCSLLYYKDLNEHIRRHKIEKILMPLDETVNKSCILRPSKFEKRPEFGEIKHPFVKNPHVYLKNYDRKVLIRWHLLLRLSLNPELTRLRKHLIKSEKDEKKNSIRNKFISKVRKIINVNRVIKTKNKNDVNFSTIKL
jgi:hypothetical protein